MVDVKGNISTTDSEKSSLLNDYFSSVFTKENVDEIPNFDKRTKSTDDIETVEVTEEEMLKLLQNLKADKSPGTDEIHPRLLKECAQSLAKPLKMLFDLSMKTSRIPSEWKVAEVRPIYKKKGKKSDPSNYRPVNLTSVVSKVAENLCDRIISKGLLSPR